MPSIADQLKHAHNGNGALANQVADVAQPQAEAAQRLKPPRQASRRRRWEADHPGFTYRIDPTLNAELKQIVHYYAERNLQTNVSLVAEAVIRAGIDEWNTGNVPVEGWQLTPVSQAAQEVEE